MEDKTTSDHPGALDPLPSFVEIFFRESKGMDRGQKVGFYSSQGLKKRGPEVCLGFCLV